MARPVRALTVLATVLTVALAGSAQAGPPNRGTTEHVAPYDGAFAGSNTSSCTDGATCTVVSDAARDGSAATSSTFARTDPATGNESAFGFGQQRITLKLPRGASEATATLRWRVEGAKAEASATEGTTSGFAGVLAFVSGCQDPCSTQVASRTLVSAFSSGLGPQTVEQGATDVVLTVKATGDLPHFLNVVTYPYSVAGGHPRRACLDADTCAVLTPEHAGTATASIRATLTSATTTVR